MKCKIIAAIAMLTAASCGYAAEQEVPMNLVSADGKEIKGRSLMLHAGGDNHHDHPEPLGGGGARMACGIIQ
ncbi:superoxide dismutase family protein [Escherichia coli]|uniref:superoxide dismutase family protein n=1 Tax=Escherichia coli TaxID=562 RepID=UPI000D59A607|nr:superoxide dismutase family protein [Escherichia coli]